TISPPASAPLVCSVSASTASRPAAVTIASRPSGGRNGGGYRFDLGKARSGIFLKTGLDRLNHIEPAQRIARIAHRIASSRSALVCHRSIALTAHVAMYRQVETRYIGTPAKKRF